MNNIKPFIKWAGGKEKEWPVIKENLPKNFERYVEPFVGGGAVYFNINAKKNIINDKSDELILLYKMIKKGNKEFYKSLDDINTNWVRLEKIVLDNSTELIELYNNYKTGSDCENLVDSFLKKHKKELSKLLKDEVDINLFNLDIEYKKNMMSKLSRMKKIESERNEMSNEDILSNLETSFKSAYYMYFRYLYNNKKKLKLSDEFFAAVFFFIRDYCYAAMFRYNTNGEFNVPYGGISYNRKDFKKKIDYVTDKS